MKSLGNIQLGRQVVSSASLGNLHLKVASVAELDEYPDQSVAVFTANDGIYHQGDIVVKTNGEWKLIDKALTPINCVRMLRGWRIDNQVFLRWHDPSDSYDINGNTVSRWKKTVLVRKYGSAPVSVRDGTIISTNTSRDRFHKSGSRAFIDIVPEVDNEFNWYYRAFAYADNGYECSSEPLKVVNMPWDNIVEEIREGNASQFFAPGDIIELPDGNELIVASIDTCKASIPAVSPHLVTFMFRYATDLMSFDSAKGRYVLTNDVYVQSGKVYYVEDGVDGNGNAIYTRARLVVGSLLRLNTYYEATYPEARIINGSNRWQSSDIRAWANVRDDDGFTVSVRKFMERMRTNLGIPNTENSKPLPPMYYLRSLHTDNSNHWVKDLADHIVATMCSTARPKIDGNSTDSTSDYFFIPSITEIRGDRNGSYIEGTQFRVFSDDLEGMTEEAFIGESGQQIFERVGWWTRSAYQAPTVSTDNGIMVEAYNAAGLPTTATPNTTNGVVFAFSIG